MRLIIESPETLPVANRFALIGRIEGADGAVQLRLGGTPLEAEFEFDAGANATRFKAAAETALFATGSATLSVWRDGTERLSETISLPENPDWAAKHRKLDRIAALLKGDPALARKPAAFDFLSPEISKKFGVVDTDNVSAHNYTPEMEALIAKHTDGWILDCGAGFRSRHYDNVVNYEIVPYPTTDVIGVCEELPFKDNTFDAVFSLAVLEHLKDPAAGVREIERVLKPGGLVWIDVAFMQPYHGYPRHFFNMTQQGLESLLSERMDIVDREVPSYGRPIWSLSWFLGAYAAGLPEAVRERFMDMPVRELVKHGWQLENEPFVTELDKAKHHELAATVSVHAVKR